MRNFQFSNFSLVRHVENYSFFFEYVSVQEDYWGKSESVREREREIDKNCFLKRV